MKSFDKLEEEATKSVESAFEEDYKGAIAAVTYKIRTMKVRLAELREDYEKGKPINPNRSYN